MYGVVHKALMAYPVFIGREADIVNYGIRTMDEGKTFPDPSSTAEPLGVGGRFAAEKVVTRGIARMIKEEALPLNPAHDRQRVGRPKTQRFTLRTTAPVFPAGSGLT